ncbi:lipopolysaccharide kinase InaA family protein [Salinihabitans flavidus]|uniref:lipopolysaccharide kinase InaA family protein n=1 Tax=Salinihabitans flavidus TaxID=569882 RepID=UPI001C31648C|nr:lipopolysaccharide kinase InaA family protein [Salinihabitans flavidus]
MKAWLSEAVPDPSWTQAPENAEILKTARQRLVLRIFFGDAHPSLVAKMFPLRNISSMLRYKKYAYQEFCNGQEARARGIRVPRPYCYFHRRLFGLVTGSGLVTEDLAGHRDILQLSRTRPGGYLEASLLAIPALLSLYHAGVHHVDARDENILIAPNYDDGTKFSIIDWQYAAFFEPRSDWLLEHLCAHYIRKAPLGEREALLNDWVKRLHGQADMDTPLDIVKQRVERLLNARPSVRARLHLKPVGKD